MRDLAAIPILSGATSGTRWKTAVLNGSARHFKGMNMHTRFFDCNGKRPDD